MACALRKNRNCEVKQRQKTNYYEKYNFTS